MEKEVLKALHEQVREQVKATGENAGFILVTVNGTTSMGTIDGNAWDLISGLATHMDESPEVGKIVRQASMINAIQGMRKGLDKLQEIFSEEIEEEPVVAPTDGN